MRPNIEMNLVGLFLAIALVGAGCAAGGDEPADQPPSSTTVPAEVGSETPESDPVADDTQVDETTTDTVPAGGAPGDDSQEGNAGKSEATVEDGTPNETRDPEVPVFEVPTPTITQPKYPDTEPVIPPPRD